MGLSLGIGFLMPSGPGLTTDGASTEFAAGFASIAISWIAFGLGAFVAGRLAYPRRDRDGVHNGLLAWAFSLLCTLCVLGGIAGPLTGGSARHVEEEGLAAAPSPLMALLPQPSNPEEVRSQIHQLIETPGSIDRVLLVQGLAIQAGISEGDADERLARFEREMKYAADSARRAAVMKMTWTVGVLLLGGILAYFGGRQGARAARRASRDD